jgi:diguanylate cyclase (GGDEF)-like protein
MSAQIDRPVGADPGGPTGAPAIVPATSSGRQVGAADGDAHATPGVTPGLTSASVRQPTAVVTGLLATLVHAPSTLAARLRSRFQRAGVTHALDWISDAWIVGGGLLLGVGAAAWLVQDGFRQPMSLPYDAPMALIGAALVAGRLGARRVRRQTAHLAVLQAASARMSRATTIEDVGRAVVEETGRIIDYHNARVYVAEPPDQVVPIAFEGRVGAYEDVDLELLRCTLGEGFTGWVAEHGVPLLVNDANDDPRGQTIPGTDEVDESMLVVPMRYDERIVGVITLSKLGLRQFAPDDLQLLSILADQAATALETARLLARSQDLAMELQRVVDMSSALSQSLDPRQVGELMARHLAGAVGVDECAISVWDEPNDRVMTMGYFPPQAPGSLATEFSLADYPETRRVLEQQSPRIVQDDDPAADRAELDFLEQWGFHTLLMLPLVAKGRSVGLVELYSKTRLELVDPALAVARSMANEAAMALDNATLYEQARELADRDPLTGFFNHRFFHERLGEEILRSSRTHRPVSLLMLDLDEFKLINDTLGHQVGDRVLTWVAEIIRSTLRASDMPARYGGDEFAVILPDADPPAAQSVAERILEAFRDRAFQPEGRGPVPIGVSIGAATYPTDGLAATALIAAADTALYGVKHQGGHGLRVAASGQQVVPTWANA